MDILHVFVYPAALMGIMGGIFGAVLAVASMVFHVKTDARIEMIRAVLPGANCAGCGYPGCDGYAESVVTEGEKTNLCSVGGSAVAAKIAEIMGVEAEEAVPRRVFVRCRGTLEASPRSAVYSGIDDCRSAAVIPGGSPNACPFGCIGFGTCVKVCAFGALSMKDGLPQVDMEKCVGCGACVEVCPKSILTLVPQRECVVVACRSHFKGPLVRKMCSAGCIGCGLCAKICPVQAITMVNDLAVIDIEKCTNCGACVAKCPTKCIESVPACQTEALPAG